MGFKTAMKVLEKGRIHIAAICVGVAERILEDALSYAIERKQFASRLPTFNWCKPCWPTARPKSMRRAAW